jgi:hypothetical protein
MALDPIYPLSHTVGTVALYEGLKSSSAEADAWNSYFRVRFDLFTVTNNQCT